ncbi:uncharacterized protein LOC128984515 [Macrosteles quadrilineatus]|uniref:uncharacterized protein LOC128984515 n=1 Tax=Macrosteles quadrilineatus TaxID=74068 RepID=UPI0023E30525|nr:uncharacterized protein LOC128984515 [Macrosteles quadrilineatus]
METNEKIDKVDGKITALAKELEQIKQENCDLKKKNDALTNRINYLEQSVKDNEIEIQGVPIEDEENILDILKNISTQISFDFNNEMISNCYRYGQSQTSEFAPGIIVQFVRRLDKDRFMKCRRKKRNLNSRDIGFMGGDATVIYVNDSLTTEKRKLLKAARQAKKNKGFTYLWVRGGRIYLRKNPDDPCVLINNYDDIKKLE